MSRIGKISILLKADDGNLDLLTDLSALFVPSSTYNLILPQFLISHMKSKGYIINNFNHDDE